MEYFKHSTNQLELTEPVNTRCHQHNTDSSQVHREHFWDRACAHQKIRANKFKMPGGTQNMFYDHNGLKFEIINRKRPGKFTNMRK